MPGIRKGYRSTERYQRGLLWACENFSDLTQVRRAYRCSSGYLYKALYAQLELQRRKRLYPWPAVVGLDEHFFRRGPRGFRQFVSMVVDFKNRRLFELVEGRTVAELEAQLASIPGRENVRFVVMDMCDPYRRFAQRFFPNARLVADKFHVLRLLSPHINRRRRLIEGDRRSAALRRLLLRSRFRLEHAERYALDQWLTGHPELRALYDAKEAMHSLYRIRGRDRASQALTGAHRSPGGVAAARVADLPPHPHALASGDPGLLRNWSHQRPHGGLQQQGEARKKASLRL